MQDSVTAPRSQPSAQEDLAILFARQMNMASPVKTEETFYAACPQVTYNVSQHYHHSTHVIHTNVEAEPLVENSASQSTANFPTTTEILKRHNIDPTSLSSSQLQLFEHAPPDQQSRLLQVWQFCPEPHAMETNLPSSGAHLDTRDVHNSFIDAASQTASPGPEGDLVMSDMAPRRVCDGDGAQYAEPYMVSGYEYLAEREYELSAHKAAPFTPEPTTGCPYNAANDPVYRSQGQRWWEHTQHEPSEYQYGAFEEMNRYPGCGLLQPHWLG
ncbi:hypothetical protein FE257_011903 [Aspergillus nanangensis]|uniref:Uncharacterized protein n=1 Tax=Aspergillus nanangensis TaxID=2582783 RepID=A0AAD4GR52_ASPNN|nr:hypothetical protein FE257_011903 [Aspergillus nanangensis]